MIGLEWLSQTVDVPLWGVLVLAGFQRVTRAVRGYRRRRSREEN